MATETDKKNNQESGSASGRDIRVGRGVAARLFLAFCTLTLMTALVALVGDYGLRDSRRTLQTSRASFDEVSHLLGNATESLEDAGASIGKANATIDNTVTTMRETSNRVNNLNSIDLPAVIAIGTIREALTAVAVGERTLLMRQLYDLDIRQQQRVTITAAFNRANAALAGLEAELGEEKLDAWREFRESWTAWAAVHERLMGEFEKIDEMLRRRVRGGFEFEDVAKNAFDIAFGDVQTARDTVNQKLDAVVTIISDSARDSAGIASADTKNATADAVAAKEGMVGAAQRLAEFKDQMGIVNARVKETTNATKASIANAERVRLIFLVCSVIGFLVSIVLALRETRYLSRPIRDAALQMGLLARGEIDRDIMSAHVGRRDEIGALAQSVGDMLHSQREEVGIAGEMASGDFSGSVTLRSNEDRLGRALSEMMRITHDALVRVNRHVQQVTAGAEAISAASESLSAGSIESATALVEISSNTTQIGEQTHRNAKNASRANEFAIASREVAERGYAAVQEMVASMQEIQTSSGQIAKIVKLIDDIAFQTNLLALNAAVEAARAGRQGKGFSVVAEEVRNLASRSAKAARDTATLVEDTVKRVENGAAIALRTDVAFKEILENAQQTTQLYGEIASASQEQSKSIDQIVASLAQIDRSTQQNSRYATRTAEEARTLSRQTGELRRMMIRFQLQGARRRHGQNELPGPAAPAAGSRQLLAPPKSLRLED